MKHERWYKKIEHQCNKRLLSHLTDDVGSQAELILTRNLWVLQLFEELFETVGLAALLPLPQLIWHQRRETAREHLTQSNEACERLPYIRRYLFKGARILSH